MMTIQEYAWLHFAAGFAVGALVVGVVGIVWAYRAMAPHDEPKGKRWSHG